MKRIGLLFAALFWWSLTHTTAEPVPVSPESLFERVSPAVVRIETKDDFGHPAAIGSGFVIPVAEGAGSQKDAAVANLLNMLSRSDFCIVTNYHVIRGAVAASVRFQDGSKLRIAWVEREDEALDLAVLRVDSDCEWPKPISSLKIDTSVPNKNLGGSPLRVGSKVFAIGNPEGLTNTLSEGLVSGFRNRNAGSGWIQTTAPISPGSSGGPLLNASGELVGITSAFLEGGQNLNFAIPVGDLCELLKKQGQLFRNLSHKRSFKQDEPAAYFGLRSRLWAQSQDKTGGKLEGAEARGRFQTYLKENGQDPTVLLWTAYEQYLDSEYALSLRTLESAARMVGSGNSKKPTKKQEFAEKIDYLVYHLMARVHYTLESEAARKNNAHDVGTGSYAETITAARKAKDLNPDFAPTHDLLYHAYSGSGKLPEALAEADALVKLMPYCGQAYSQRGEVLELLGRHEAAIADLTEAMDLNPSDARSMSELGVAYAAVGKHAEAIAAHRHALKLQEPEYAWFNHSELAEEYEKLNNLELAIKEFQLAADGSPDQKMRGAFEARLARCRAKLSQVR